MAELKTAIVIEAEDRFSRQAKQIGEASKKLGKAAEQVGDKLRALDKRDKTIQEFHAVETRLGKAGAEMDRARKRASELGRKLKEAGIPTKKLERASLDLTRAQKKMAREADSAQDAARKATEAHRLERNELGRLGAELREAGIDTRRLGDEQRRLAREMDAAGRKMDQYRGRAERITRMQGKLDRFTRHSAQLSLIAGEGSRLVGGAMRIAAAPIDRLVGFESALGEVATLFVDASGALDRASVDTIGDAAWATARRTVGLEPAEYLRAAYLTKSGISGLDAQGVVDMTDLAALTARATVADTMEIADLFKSAYTRFKDALYGDLTTREFGTVFSAQIAQAVQQFATDGRKMAQAFASAGNDMTLAGVSLADQFAVLGMLQGTEQAGVAGTTMLALSSAAGEVRNYRVTLADRPSYARVEAHWYDVQAARRVVVSAEGGAGDAAYSLPGNYPDAETARQAAQAKLAALNRDTGALRLTLAPGNPLVRTETPLTLTGFRDGVDGPWIVTRAAHELGSNGYATRIAAETAA